MPHYFWQGIDITGTTHKGYIQARNETTVQALLLKQNIALITCKKQNPVQNYFLSFSLSSKKINTQDIILFFDLLAHLLKSGLDLLSTLMILYNQHPNQALKQVIHNIIIELEQGVSFSKALAQYPQIFSPFIVHSISIGETGNNLQVTLEQLVTHLEQKQKLTQALWNAALMPLVTLGFAFVIISLILLFVIPQFDVFFGSFNKNLPAATKVLISLSTCLREYSLYIFSGILGIVLVGIILISRYSLALKTFLFTLGHYIPLFNTVLINAELIHFFQTLSFLASSGCPINQGISFAIDTLHDKHFKTQGQRIPALLSQGKPLSECLHTIQAIQAQAFLLTMVKIGEASGNLGLMLKHATTLLQNQYTKSLSRITTLFQPLLIFIIGVIIAIFMVIIYSPIFNLAYSFTL